MAKKLLFVFNPLAGKGLVKANLCDIIDVFTKQGYEVTAYPTQAPADGYEKVKCVAQEYDLIVACGGDGTLSEVVKALMKQAKKIPLGYIPAGSTNDFATSMGIPTKMTDAAAAIMNGVRFDYDIGEFNGQYYVYVAAFGAFTDVPYVTSQNLKNTLGHAAYIIEGIKRLTKITSHKMVVKHDDEVIEGNFILGLVTNTVSVGGMKNLITDGVCFDDGFFEVTLVKTPSNLMDLQKAITETLFSNLVKEKSIITFKTSKVTFASEDEVAWTLDGEYAAFGKVIEGQDIVNKIATTQTDYSDRPLAKQMMKTVTVDCFGVEYAEPEQY